MEGLNPWVRANMEQQIPETEALIGEQFLQDYLSLMERLQAAKTDVNEALAVLYQVEQERADFFGALVNGA